MSGWSRRDYELRQCGIYPRWIVGETAKTRIDTDIYILTFESTLSWGYNLRVTRQRWLFDISTPCDEIVLEYTMLNLFELGTTIEQIKTKLIELLVEHVL